MNNFNTQNTSKYKTKNVQDKFYREYIYRSINNDNNNKYHSQLGLHMLLILFLLHEGV